MANLPLSEMLNWKSENSVRSLPAYLSSPSIIDPIGARHIPFPPSSTKQNIYRDILPAKDQSSSATTCGLETGQLLCPVLQSVMALSSLQEQLSLKMLHRIQLLLEIQLSIDATALLKNGSMPFKEKSNGGTGQSKLFSNALPFSYNPLGIISCLTS